MMGYDFTAATDYLNNEVPLDALYGDVLEAMHTISSPRRYLDREAQLNVWRTLITVADFIATIELANEH